MCYYYFVYKIIADKHRASHTLLESEQRSYWKYLNFVFSLTLALFWSFPRPCTTQLTRSHFVPAGTIAENSYDACM